LLKIDHAFKGCRNLARRIAFSKKRLSKFHANAANRNHAQLTGKILFRTLNRAKPDKGKCYLNENFALSCY
jgi:hypothetical protein